MTAAHLLNLWTCSRPGDFLPLSIAASAAGVTLAELLRLIDDGAVEALGKRRRVLRLVDVERIAVTRVAAACEATP